MDRNGQGHGLPRYLQLGLVITDQLALASAAVVHQVELFLLRNPRMIFGLVGGHQVEQDQPEEGRDAWEVEDQGPSVIDLTVAQETGQRVVHYVGHRDAGKGDGHQSGLLLRRGPDREHVVDGRDGETRQQALGNPQRHQKSPMNPGMIKKLIKSLESAKQLVIL